jgi:two-component system sensor histidine kinase RegB
MTSLPIVAHRAPTDPVGLAWLVNVRWTALLAGASALFVGRSAVQSAAPIVLAAVLAVGIAASNLWLIRRVRADRSAGTITIAGVLICADVVFLSWCLLESGGVLNPASVCYLVLIVVAALTLGRAWTWIVTTLAVGAYAALFLTPTNALSVAQAMHPEIAAHMHGMWLAFALTALVIAVLVTRLTIAVERRDRALEVLHDHAARASRVAGLATVAAGAAHELGTPLATMAVAVHELERSLASGLADQTAIEDARLIRTEIDRCRKVLERMIGQIAEPMGEPPRAVAVREVLNQAVGRLSGPERDRVALHVDTDDTVIWPVNVVSQALANVVQNALQASDAGQYAEVSVSVTDDDRVRITTADRGRGMTPDTLARAGEPFFTTKPPGGGTGLGLFVTRSAVEQLGGLLILTSVVGEGTTAAIELPRNVVHSAQPAHE